MAEAWNAVVRLVSARKQTSNTLRVHVPNNWVLGIWVIVLIVLVLGKYMIIRYLDPQGYRIHGFQAGVTVLKSLFHLGFQVRGLRVRGELGPAGSFLNC